jgi:hypothetical protein
MPQLPTVSPLNAFADQMRAVLAERLAERHAAELEAYKRSQDEIANQFKNRQIAVPEGQLVLDNQKFIAEAPQRAADVAQTIALTGKTNQDVSFDAEDHGKRNNVIAGLSNVSMNGRLSPRQAAEARVFAGVDFMNPAGERATVGAADLGKEAGQAAAAESASGALKALADAERVKANEQIRVNNARPRADDAKSGPASEMAATVKAQALATVRKLKTMAGRTGATGLKNASSLFGLLNEPIAGTDEADFVSELNTLKARLTLPQLQMMKGMGALSDMEGQRIERAVSSLNRNMKDTTFLAELDAIEQALTGGNAMQPMTSRDATSSPVIRTLKNGQRIRVTKTYPDGTFDGEPVQ